MHTSPDVLALLALGEEVGTQAELAHLQECRVCRTELSQLSHAVEVGRADQRGGRVAVTETRGLGGRTR